jgi:hypothetical protein
MLQSCDALAMHVTMNMWFETSQVLTRSSAHESLRGLRNVKEAQPLPWEAYNSDARQFTLDITSLLSFDLGI